MIDKAIDFLKDEVNAYLKLNVGEESADTLKPANLLSQDGSIDATLENSPENSVFSGRRNSRSLWGASDE